MGEGGAALKWGKEGEGSTGVWGKEGEGGTDMWSAKIDDIS